MGAAGHDGQFPAEAVSVCGDPAAFTGLAEAALQEVFAVVGEIDGGAEVVFASAGAGDAFLVGAMTGDGAHVKAVLVLIIAECADDLNVEAFGSGGADHLA